jgi:hypothetical protein
VRIKRLYYESLKRRETSRMQPIIEIQDTEKKIIIRGITLSDQEGNKIPFFVNSIAVSNSGKCVAKDCQVYIKFAQNKIQRIAWTLPNSNTALSITLEVGISQYVDLCAITQDGYFRLIMNEYGLTQLRHCLDHKIFLL